MVFASPTATLTATAVIVVLLAASSTDARVLRACLQTSSVGKDYYYEIVSDPANDASGTTFDRYLVIGPADNFVDSTEFAALRKTNSSQPWYQGVQFTDTMQRLGVWVNSEPTTIATFEHDEASGVDTLTFFTTVNGAPQHYMFRTTNCRSAWLPNPSIPAPPNTTSSPSTSPVLHSCLQTSSAGNDYYYQIVSDPSNDASGTTFYRYLVVDGVDSFVDSNQFAALQRPVNPRRPWYQGIEFTDTMQQLGVWVSAERTTLASFEHDEASGENTLTFFTTVNGAPQHYMFRTTNCRNPVTAVPTGPQNITDARLKASAVDVAFSSNPPLSGWVLYACLQTSLGGKDYLYEVFSDPSNDAGGTTFDRYLVEGGVDSFVDSNQFAALREPDGDLPWHQGVQIVEAMQSRGAWINVEPTTSASIEHDDVSGDVTLTFHTTLHGKPETFAFSTSKCR
jgi:hypothetical protein